jgi:hypothetical protein|eukprot:COSAG06_NODE_2710_length_6406_cov_2.807198_8_plen_35_part_00
MISVLSFLVFSYLSLYGQIAGAYGTKQLAMGRHR